MERYYMSELRHSAFEKQHYEMEKNLKFPFEEYLFEYLNSKSDTPVSMEDTVLDYMTKWAKVELYSIQYLILIGESEDKYQITEESRDQLHHMGLQTIFKAFCSNNFECCHFVDSLTKRGIQSQVAIRLHKWLCNTRQLAKEHFCSELGPLGANIWRGVPNGYTEKEWYSLTVEQQVEVFGGRGNTYPDFTADDYTIEDSSTPYILK